MWGGLSYSPRMICSAVCALLVSIAPWLSGEALTGPAKVTAVTGSQIGDETAITIVATKPVRYQVRNVRSDWIVIDIPGTQLGRPAGQVPVVRGLVKRVRVGQFMPNIVRVVVELIQPVEFHLASTFNRQGIVVGIPMDIGGRIVARAQAVGYQTVTTQADALAIGPETLNPQGPPVPPKTTSASNASTGAPNPPEPGLKTASTPPVASAATSPQGPPVPTKTTSASASSVGTPSPQGPSTPVKTTGTSTASTEAPSPQGPPAPAKMASTPPVSSAPTSPQGPSTPVKTTSTSTASAEAPSPQGPSVPAKTASPPPVSAAVTGAQASLPAPKVVTNPQTKLRGVVPGHAIGSARLGMSVQDLVATFGPSVSTDHMPDGTTVYRWFKAPKNAGIGVRASADGVILRVWALNDVGYVTNERLHAGSTEAEIRAALGEPSQSFINAEQKLKTLTYSALGVWFSIQLDERYLFYNSVFEIGIMQPR